MSDAIAVETAQLIEMLDASVAYDDVRKITEAVQRLLSRLFRAGSVRLPERFYQPSEECYARRLLHRDERLGYTAVVMTWGPGQCTPLHDHAGIWCVEGVLQGEMIVTRFNLLERQDDRCMFEQVEQIRASVGSSGSLIPPYEYHVLGNALDDRPSITLHVYGGEMDHCCAYQPLPDGWHERLPRALTYVD